MTVILLFLSMPYRTFAAMLSYFLSAMSEGAALMRPADCLSLASCLLSSRRMRCAYPTYEVSTAQLNRPPLSFFLFPLSASPKTPWYKSPTHPHKSLPLDYSPTNASASWHLLPAWSGLFLPRRLHARWFPDPGQGCNWLCP